MQQLLRQVLRDEGEGPESTAVLVQITVGARKEARPGASTVPIPCAGVATPAVQQSLLGRLAPSAATALHRRAGSGRGVWAVSVQHAWESATLHQTPGLVTELVTLRWI